MELQPPERPIDEGSHESTDGANSVYELFPPVVKLDAYEDYRSRRLQRIQKSHTWLLGINMSVKSFKDEAEKLEWERTQKQLRELGQRNPW